MRGRRWYIGDFFRRVKMLGNLGFFRLENWEGFGFTGGFEFLGFTSLVVLLVF